jgi:hypothetical protein
MLPCELSVIRASFQIYESAYTDQVTLKLYAFPSATTSYVSGGFAKRNFVMRFAMSINAVFYLGITFKNNGNKNINHLFIS